MYRSFKYWISSCVHVCVCSLLVDFYSVFCCVPFYRCAPRVGSCVFMYVYASFLRLTSQHGVACVCVCAPASVGCLHVYVSVCVCLCVYRCWCANDRGRLPWSSNCCNRCPTSTCRPTSTCHPATVTEHPTTFLYNRSSI